MDNKHMLKQLDNKDLCNILKHSPVGIALSDTSRNITWVNDTFQSHLGINATEISGHSIYELPKSLIPLFVSSTTVHVPASSLREEQWVMCSQADLDNKGNSIHYMTDVSSVYLLIQEREALKRKLKEALAIDSVTGMPNREALFKNLDQQISRSRRYNNELSIIIMRIKDLGALDDEQSKNVLILISQMLKDHVRWADIIGKLNESDFFLILPETAAEACENLSTNLNTRLSEISIPDGELNNFKISANFGYAEWAKGDDLNLLMQKAQKMLESV